MSSHRLHLRAAPDPQRERFVRHSAIAGWNQTRLAELHVLVVGAGALGNAVLENLALVGVGRITIVDFDRVELGNLSRSPLFRPEDRGRPKAEVCAERLDALHPQGQHRAIVGDLHTELGPGALAEADIILCGLDSVDARLGLARMARAAERDWWNGALGVSAAEITRYGFRPEDPCFACSLGRERLAREAQRWSCQDGRPALEPQAVVPTTAVSAALGGALLVQEALASAFPKWSERALPPGDRILVELSPHRLTRFQLNRDPECFEHEAPPPLHHLPLTREASFAEAFACLGASPEDRIELGYDLATTWSCGCADPPPLGRAVRSLPERCAVCEQRPQAIETTSRVGPQDPWAQQPMSAAGLGSGAEFLAFGPGRLTRHRLATDTQSETECFP